MITSFVETLTVVFSFYNYTAVWMPVEPHIVAHAYHEETKKGDEVCKKLRCYLFQVLLYN
jgi:hypothetical protein